MRDPTAVTWRALEERGITPRSARSMLRRGSLTTRRACLTFFRAMQQPSTSSAQPALLAALSALRNERRDDSQRYRAAVRTAAHALRQWQQTVDQVLMLQRNELPDRVADSITTQANGAQALDDVLQAVAAQPCSDAGDYLSWLADRLARRCSTTYAIGNSRSNAAFRLQLTARRECAICFRQHSECVQLDHCTHATFCVACLASHVTEKLRAGCCPSCPLCVTPFARREILALTNARGFAPGNA